MLQCWANDEQVIFDLVKPHDMILYCLCPHSYAQQCRINCSLTILQSISNTHNAIVSSLSFCRVAHLPVTIRWNKRRHEQETSCVLRHCPHTYLLVPIGALEYVLIGVDLRTIHLC